MKISQKALLILALELSFGVPAIFPQKVDVGFRKQDQYWAESDLNELQLQQYLQDSNCYADQTRFLGCANAILLAADRYNYDLDFRMEGRKLKVVWRYNEKPNFSKNEKERLSIWQKHIPDLMNQPTISFWHAWIQLRDTQIKASEFKAIMAKAINGYFSVVEDPHTYLIPVAMYKDVFDQNDRNHNFLGWIYQKTSQGVQIRKIFEGSLAAKVGLKKADLILEVNDRRVEEFTSTELYETLNMVGQHRISFLIKRMVAGKNIQTRIDFFKKDYPYEQVYSQRLASDNRVAVLTVNKFSQGVCYQAEKQIKALAQDNLQGLILDLRDNPGGRVDEAACLINLFVEKGTQLFRMEFLDKSKLSETYVAGQPQLFKGKLAVLINGGSASASEIVAGSLKDLSRALIVGERSFGKGTFQDGQLWNKSSEIAMFKTQGVYVFPSGWTAQLQGVEPDRLISDRMLPIPLEKDIYLSAINVRYAKNLKINQAKIISRIAGLVSTDLCVPNTTEEDPQINEAASTLFCGSL